MSTNLYLFFAATEPGATLPARVRDLSVPAFSRFDQPLDDLIEVTGEEPSPVRLTFYTENYFRVYVAELAIQFHRGIPPPREVAAGERWLREAVLRLEAFRLRRWLLTQEGWPLERPQPSLLPRDVRDDSNEDPVMGCLLYVVPMEASGQLDPATETVASVFGRHGFRVVVHAGPASVAEVLGGVHRSGAQSVLLSEGGSNSDLRSLTKALVDDVVEWVMAVRKNPPEAGEGDWYEPFAIHPDEGEDRMVTTARFVWRALLGSGSGADHR
jgi:hypothetical protein